MNGLLVVNKPSGVTSRRVVDRAEQWFPGVKIGHAGTLDPLATGVLVLCLGDAARLIEYVQELDKTYEAALRLGAWSDTDDRDGAVQVVDDPAIPETRQIAEVLDSFAGAIEQTPPAYSAVRVEGSRAHKLARRGRDVPLLARRVRIDGVELVHYAFPSLTLRIHCGKGTYIRALARSAGERLGCGALVESLHRTRIGRFTSTDAFPLSADAQTVMQGVLPPRAAVDHLPAVSLPRDWLLRLSLGEWIPLRMATLISGNFGGSGANSELAVAVINERGELAAIALVTNEKALRPRKVFKSACPAQTGQSG